MRNRDGRRMLVMVALAALLCGCRDTGDEPVDAGGPLVSERGRIAFTRITKLEKTNIDSDIYTVNVDGSGERRLTRTPRTLDGSPAWSPDGERLAFVSDRDGGDWEIYVMTPDGTGQRRLTRSLQDEAFLDWSPDGQRIAFSTDPTVEPAVWVMDVDGSDRKRLTGGAFPSWSPDGRRIAYTDYFGDRPYLAIMNADGTGQHGVGASSVEKVLGINMSEEPGWSPEGERIAFASLVDSDNEDIFAMDPDGSDLTRLTDGPGNDHWPPTWSPDGRRISFTSDAAGGMGEIYAMNADGSGLTRLTNEPADDITPAWQP